MGHWSLAGLVSLSIAASSVGMGVAIANPVALESKLPSAQCVHPQRGLTSCEVSLDRENSRLLFVWPDGESTELNIGNDKTQVRDHTQTEWQEARYVGLCHGQQCFQTKIHDYNMLEYGNEEVAAQCFDPMNGTSACTVQTSADAQKLTVNFINGSGFSLAQQSNQPLGLCVDNICAFSLPPALGESDRLAQAPLPRLSSSFK